MQIPTLLALLTCDRVIIEADGGKKTLVGLFDTIFASSVPASQNVGLFARIIEGQGDHTLRVRIVNLAQGEAVLAALEGSIHFENPLEPVELAVNMPLVFPTEGRYEVQVFVGEFYLGRSTISVKLTKELR